MSKNLVVRAMMLAVWLIPGFSYAQVNVPDQCPPGTVKPPSGLVAWWRMEETSGTSLDDFSIAADNPGTASVPVGPTTGIRSVPALVNNGLNFYFGRQMNVPVSPSLTFDPPASKNNSFTIDLWIKGGATPLLSNLSPAKKGYRLSIVNNRVKFELGRGTSGGILTLSGPTLAPRAWNFVAVTVSRPTPRRVIMYVGTAGGPSLSSVAVSVSAIPTYADSGQLLIVGGCQGNPNGCTVFDEVEIYNRALTAAELTSIFKAGSAGKCLGNIAR